MKRIHLLILLFAFITDVYAQEQFSVSIVPSSITVMPPVHSGAFAEWNGKWIIIGGRSEGLHNFQSGIAFSSNGRNDSVFVIDPSNNLRWSAAADSLPVDLFESIFSTNMEFYRDSSTLYMIGGFGRQDSISSWITFPTLAAIDLNGLMSAVINGTDIAPYFRQVTDSNLAVTGGHLEKIDSTYYLIFGQRFNGIYDNTIGSILFNQHYTTEIRKFKIHDNGSSLSISDYSTVQDTDNFHRRDYNLVPQIYPNDEYGFTAFGGVFQKFANLPYLSPIDIRDTSTHVNSSFNQNLNQYETASMPVYDSANNFMHTIFFGGMSLYTYDTLTHALVQDTLVPFVNTISKVSRDSLGNLAEYSLPVHMPSLLGSNARFIADTSVSLLHHGIIDLNALSGNTKVGYIVSGIQSDLPNVAGLDPAGMSRANKVVFEIYINKIPDAVQELMIKNAVNDLSVYPNPSHGIFNIGFSLNEKEKVEVEIVTVAGKKITTLFEGIAATGFSKFTWDGSRTKPGTYFCRIKAGTSDKAVKLILAK